MKKRRHVTEDGDTIINSDSDTIINTDRQYTEGAIHMSQVLKKLAMEPNQLMNIFIDVIDFIRIQKATKVSISSSKSKKGARWVFKRQAHHNAAEGMVRLLILKHIKLEDIDMWFCGS